MQNLTAYVYAILCVQMPYISRIWGKIDFYLEDKPRILKPEEHNYGHRHGGSSIVTGGMQGASPH